jgi:hypothetical protein
VEVGGMPRALIVAGIALIVIGLTWPWLSKLPFGRLPGDLHIARDGFSVYLPLATGLLISVVVSLIAWWLRK